MLFNVTSKHESTWTCEASNEVNTEPDKATATVTVVPVPRFVIVPPINITAPAGSRVQIDCKGTSRSKIIWEREGGNLTKNHLFLSNGTLVLLNISESTAGYYFCKAQTVFRSVLTKTRVLLQKRSCSHVKAANPSAESGYYVIDPDGERGEKPFRVYCDMTDENGVGVTIVSHDSEKRSLVKGCEPKGCFVKNVSYTPVSLKQLAALENVSLHCEQFIKFECRGDIEFIEDKSAWWVSREGKPMYYWGGAFPNSGRCACGMDGSCEDGGLCNCKNAQSKLGWREDEGLLTDKASLPVIQLRFGDVGDSKEDGFYTLGRFKCHSLISSAGW